MKITKNRLFISIILTYLCIIFIPMVIITSKDMIAYKYVQNELEKMQYALLYQIAENMDKDIKKIKEIDDMLQINEEISQLLNSNRAMATPYIRTTLYLNLRDDLKAYHISNDIIKNIIVYIPKQNIVLDCNGLIDMNTYYQLKYSNIDLTIEKLHDIFTHSTGMEYITDKKGNIMIYYINHVPSITGEQTISYIMELDNQEIAALLKRMLYNKDVAAFIRNEHGYEIAYMSNGEHKINVDECNLYTLSSQENGWTYHIATKSYQIKTLIKSLVKMTLLSASIYGLIAIGIACYFSYRQYLSLAGILKLFRREQRFNNKLNYEYQFIKDSINEMKLKNKQLEREIIDQKQLKQKQELFLLLIGKKNMKNMDLSEFREIFPYKNFMLMTIILKKPIPNNNWMQELSLIKNNYKYVQCEMDFCQIVIIVNSEEPVAKMKRQMILWAKKVFNMAEYKTVFAHIAISESVESPYLLHRIYHETEKIIEYLQILKKQIGTWEEIRKFFKDNIQIFTYKEQNCINYYVKEKNAEKIEEIFKRALIRQQHMTKDGKKIFLYFLLNTVELICEEWDIPKQKLKEYDKVIDCYNNDLIRIQNIEVIQKQLFDNIKKYEANRKQENDKIKQILQYIEEHYLEIELNASQIAYVFEMTPYTLSRYFKKNVGKGVIEYITSRRIEHAKKLLIETTGTLEEVATQCGFLNSKSLIRVFKKVENITPAKYRKNYEIS